MPDATASDLSHGYPGSPEAYDFHRSTHSRAAEQAKIRALAAARQQQAAQPKPADNAGLEKRLAALERALPARNRPEAGSGVFTVRAWYRGVGIYVDLKSWT